MLYDIIVALFTILYRVVCSLQLNALSKVIALFNIKHSRPFLAYFIKEIICLIKCDRIHLIHALTRNQRGSVKTIIFSAF